MPYEVKFVDVVQNAELFHSGSTQVPGQCWSSTTPADIVTPANGVTGYQVAKSSQLLAAIPRGTSENERLGRKLKVLSIDYVGTVRKKIPDALKGNSHYAEPEMTFAIWVVWDRQNNNSSGNKISDIWVDEPSYVQTMAAQNLAGVQINVPMVNHKYVRRSLDENRRFRILKKFVFTLPKLNPGENTPECVQNIYKTVKFHCPINKIVSYNADLNPPAPGIYDGDQMPNGTIGLYLMGPQRATGTFDTLPEWSIGNQQIRIRFMDM